MEDPHLPPPIDIGTVFDVIREREGRQIKSPLCCLAPDL